MLTTRLLASTLLWVAVAPVAKAVPNQVNYQGALQGPGGAPITGVVDLVFTLYDDELAGDPIWTESHDGVEVLDGVYEVALGSQNPLLPAVLAAGSE